MSNKIICAVWDSATQSYGALLTFKAKGEAIRSFMDEINREDPNNALNKHSDDYELHQLSEYDDTTGALMLGKSALLARGKDMKQGDAT